MVGLDLFTGIGGITEALAGYVDPVAYCETDRKCQAILLSRIHRGEIPNAPIWDDVRTLRGGMLPRIEIITGGFPCQDISLAGRRKGLAGSRSSLFFEVVRLAEETKAPFVFLENVWPGIRRFIPTIRAVFKELGYKTRDGILSASDVGLPHRRTRWFFLAHAMRKNGRLQSGRWSGPEGPEGPETLQPCPSMGKWEFTNPLPPSRWQGERAHVGSETAHAALAGALERNDWHDVASEFCGVDHGISHRLDRIGALGNSVVPAQARTAFEILWGLSNGIRIRQSKRKALLAHSTRSNGFPAKRV